MPHKASPPAARGQSTWKLKLREAQGWEASPDACWQYQLRAMFCLSWYCTGYVSSEAFSAYLSQQPLGSGKLGGRLMTGTAHFGVHGGPSPVHKLSEAQALEKEPQCTALFKGAIVGRTGISAKAPCSTAISMQQAAGKAGQHWALLVHKALSKLKDGLLSSQFQTSESTEVPGGNPRPQMPGSQHCEPT